MSQSHARRRYLIRIAIASAIYVLTVFLAIHVLAHQHMSMPFAIALALFPSIPIVAIIAIVGLYLKEEKDDFQRELFIKSLLWATGATLAVTSLLELPAPLRPRPARRWLPRLPPLLALRRSLRIPLAALLRRRFR